jgi:hypothetical protein
LPAARSDKYQLIFADLEIASRAELAGVDPARSPSPGDVILDALPDVVQPLLSAGTLTGISFAV